MGEPEQAEQENGTATGAEPADRAGSPAEEAARELEERLLRVAAEFENYKKRRARETEDLLRYGYESLARDLLPVLDSLERAISSSEGVRDYDAFHDGVVLILEQFREAMRRHGIERLEPRGELFDPHAHEAVGVMPHPDLEPGHIAEVLEPGYRMHDRVLRAPRVLVTHETDEASGADEPPAPDDDAAEGDA